MNKRQAIWKTKGDNLLYLVVVVFKTNLFPHLEIAALEVSQII